MIYLDISHFNTSKVIDMASMFNNMYSLKYLNLTNFDTKNVINMSYMFYNCSSLKYLDISNLDVSNVQYMKNMFDYCSSLKYLDVSNFNVSNVQNMNYMFRHCSSLIELNLSNWNAKNNIHLNSFLEHCSSLKYVNFTNFNTENVEYMHNMFSGCSNLTFLDLSHFNTSKIEYFSNIFSDCNNLIFLNLSNWGSSKIKNMEYIFRDCHSLIEIDLSNFNTLNVEQMNSMFHNCYSLISLDLSSFDTSHVRNMGHMFYGCKSLISLNITHFNTSNVRYIDNMFAECNSLNSLDISNFKSKHIKKLQNMFEGCSNLSYINMSNFIEYNSTESIYNNLFNKIKDNLIICIQKNQTPIITKLVNKIGCATIYCGEDFFRIKKKFDIYKNECLYECNETEFLFEEKCYTNCSNVNYIDNCQCELDKELYKNCPLSLDGYYLDINDLYYKSCYYSCKTCNISGNITYHNCLECKYNYYNISLSSGYKNCYCSYYFYFDKNSSIYFCTKNNLCPNEYPFEIISTKQCVDKCKIDLILKEECKLNFEENKNNKNKIEMDNTKPQDIMLRNVEISFISEEYNTSNLDKGKEEIIKDEIMQITLTTTKTQKNNYNNNNNNMTSIDFGNCETLLRKENNISVKELLYMRKIDVYQEGVRIPKVEFDIYYKKNNNQLKKLNLTICENSNIYISYPIEISENPDIYNPKSDYYNNICYPATSNRVTDITLTDRQIEFVEENKTLCQDGCYLEKYDNINKNSKCSCKGKEFKSIINSISDIKINKMKLFENFINVNNILNIQIIKCYKILFSKDGIINNIAFYLIIPIILFHIISIFVFYLYEKKVIFNEIDKIIFAILNIHLIIKSKKKNKKIKDKNELINKNNLELIDQEQKILKFKNDLIKQSENNIINNNIIQNKIDIKNNNIEEKEELKEIKLLSPFEHQDLTCKLSKNLQNVNPPIKKDNKVRNSKFNHKINNEKETENSIRNILNNKNKEEILEKLKKIMEYNDKEINEFTYEHALKYDKRNYIQYYFSLLKTKYILIFTFYTSNDYNSKIVKIDLFFIGFVSNYAINALFFNDDNMHKIYEDYGKFDILYQLPQIIYSYLISSVFDYLLNLLGLSEDDIIDFKKIRKKLNISNKAKSLKNKLNIKFTLYFIISMIFLLCFWYYLSIFCAVYKNTQHHLIKDTLVSFGISLITPLGFYLLPCIFRIPSLSDEKNKKYYLFKFSQIFENILII